MAKPLESQSHLLHICLILSPRPHKQEQVEPQKAGQQGHPNRVVGHTQEELDRVFNIHGPGHYEEVAAKVGQVVTEALGPHNCALWPDLEQNRDTDAKEGPAMKRQHRLF